MNRATSLKSALESRPSEATVKRMWDEIEARRHAPRPVRLYRWAGAIAVAAGLVLAIAAVMRFTGDSGDALLLSNRASMPEKVFTPQIARFEFVDGSHIETRPQTQFDVVMNRQDAIEFALRKGAMAVQVTPGGQRKWTIHCGEVDVTVVGTAFDVVRTPYEVVVKVHRGKVCVKGAQVPDGIQILTADMQIRVPSGSSRAVSPGVAGTLPRQPLVGTSQPAVTSTPHRTVVVGTAMDSENMTEVKDTTPPPVRIHTPVDKGDDAPVPRLAARSMPDGNGSVVQQVMSREPIAPVAGAGAPSDHADTPSLLAADDGNLSASPVPSRPEDMPQWKALARSQNFDAAYMALPAFTFSTLSGAHWPPDDLFLLSDIARVTGHPREACLALGELIRRYPGNPRAGIAAYTMARVTSESLKQPSQGAVYYEQALTLGISKALRETALMRLIQAYRHSLPEKAQHYRDIYLAEYPGGRYLEEINP
ncbi:MAG: FecR domain-containing protein [Deltaproteobacteria bacterium]|nr:FecR domain-containing protein [Deltaproteobacteria bacterium]